MATEPLYELTVGDPKDLISEMSLTSGKSYLLQNRAPRQSGILRYFIGGASAPSDLNEGQDLERGERLILTATTEPFWAWGHVDTAIASVSEST